MRVDWRLWYHTRETFSNLDGPWEDAPGVGVLCVVVRDPTGAWGRFVHSGPAPMKRPGVYNEFFVKASGEEPYATDDFKPFLEIPGTTMDMVKSGHHTTQRRWQEIMTAACNDSDFPKGTPRRRHSDWREI